MSITIRKATEADAALILAFVRKLAAFEELEHHLIATSRQIREALSEPDPRLHALIASMEGVAIGFATYYPLYSTFAGKTKYYMEDLYVEPDFRGRGIARKLVAALAEEAQKSGCAGLEWKVLDWNEEAISFYRGIGAKPIKTWLSYGMDEKAMERLTSDQASDQPATTKN